MKNLHLIIFTFLFISCSSPKSDDILGIWRPVSLDNENIIINQLKLSEQFIEIVDNNEFKQIFEYETNEGNLIIKIHCDSIKVIPFNLSSDKKLLTFDSLKFVKSNYDEYSGTVNEVYKLIEIPTDSYFNKDPYTPTIHLYKSKDNILKIRGGEVLLKNKDIYSFLHAEDGTNNINDINIFLGYGVNTVDLINLYYTLIESKIVKVNLIIQNKGFVNFGVFKDIIEIWFEDYINYSESNNKPLPEEKYLRLPKRSDFISNDTEIISVNYDLKIDNIDEGKRYLFSINKDIEIKDYIEVKKYVNYLRDTLGLEILTEIK